MMRRLTTNIVTLGMAACITLVIAGCGSSGGKTRLETELETELMETQQQLAEEEAARKKAEEEATAAEAAKKLAEEEAAAAEAAKKLAEEEAAAAEAAKKLAEEEAAAAEAAKKLAEEEAAAAEAAKKLAEEEAAAAEEAKELAEADEQATARALEEAQQQAQTQEANQRAEKLKEAFPGGGDSTTLPTISQSDSPVSVTARRGSLRLTRGGHSPATLSGTGVRTATMPLTSGGDAGKTVVYTDRELSLPLLEHFGDSEGSK